MDEKRQLHLRVQYPVTLRKAETFRVGLEPTASRLEVWRATIAPAELGFKICGT